MSQTSPDVSESPLAHALVEEIQLLLASGPPTVDRIRAVVRLADEGRVLLQTLATIRGRLGVHEPPRAIEMAAEPAAHGQPPLSQRHLRRSLGLRVAPPSTPIIAIVEEALASRAG